MDFAPDWMLNMFKLSADVTVVFPYQRGGIGKIVKDDYFGKIPESHTEYVNSASEIQKNPFNGDVINSYNDGPTDNGSQLGPIL